MNGHGPGIPRVLVEPPEPETGPEVAQGPVFREVSAEDIRLRAIGHFYILDPPKENPIGTQLPEIPVILTPLEGPAGFDNSRADRYSGQCSVTAQLKVGDPQPVSAGQGLSLRVCNWLPGQPIYELRASAVVNDAYRDRRNWACVLRPGVVPEGIYKYRILVRTADGNLVGAFDSYGFLVVGRRWDTDGAITDEMLGRSAVT